MGKRYRIGIVDDEPLVLEFLKRILEEDEISVCATFDNDRSFLKALPSLKCDLLVMDIALGTEKDGIDLARLAMKTRKIPSLFVSGHSEIETRKRLKGTHHFGFVLKPFHPAELQIVVQNALIRAELEHKLEHTQQKLKKRNQQLDAMSRRIQSLQDEEYKKLAEEIHDFFGQELMALKMNVGYLKKRAKEHEFLEKVLPQMDHSLQKMTDWVHFVSGQLHPVALDHLGFVGAVEHLCEEAQGLSSVPIVFSSNLASIPAFSSEAIVLFRIVREALMNALKHAQATQIEVGIEYDGNHLCVEVKDDGKGFDTSQKSDHHGLFFIRERSRFLGADLYLQSEVEKGCSVRVRWKHSAEFV